MVRLTDTRIFPSGSKPPLPTDEQKQDFNALSRDQFLRVLAIISALCLTSLAFEGHVVRGKGLSPLV